MRERGQTPEHNGGQEHQQTPRSGSVYDRQAAEAKTRHALETLEQGIAQIVDSDSFAAYLHAASRFHTYSAGNIALIHAQDRDATQVAGYTTWQRLGRQVRKGEHGLTILVPHKVKIETEEGDDPLYTVRSFGLGTVFDIRQTDGQPVPLPPLVAELQTASDAGRALYGHLHALVEREGITVRRVDTGRPRGWYDPLRKEIAVHERLRGDQATKTLAHETAHYVAAHHGFTPATDAETIAESTAYVVLSHFGLDTSSYSFPYVATWATDTQVLKRNLSAIQKTATQIIQALEGPAQDTLEQKP